MTMPVKGHSVATTRLKLATSAVIKSGEFVILTSGLAGPGTTITSQLFAGLSTGDASETAGDTEVPVEMGPREVKTTFTGASLTDGDVGKDAYVLTANTATLTPNTAPIGRITRVISGTVAWVMVEAINSPVGATGPTGPTGPT